jgi:hypothetical protein
VILFNIFFPDIAEQMGQDNFSIEFSTDIIPACFSHKSIIRFAVWLLISGINLGLTWTSIDKLDSMSRPKIQVWEI